jgi:hypothetical protein
MVIGASCAPAPTSLEYGDVPEFASENLIPVLNAPAGAQLYGGGGGGGGNGMGLGVVFGSELALDEVYQHYADQLTAAGWRFLSREDETGELRSFWELTDSHGVIWPARFDITLGGPDDPEAYNVYVTVLQPH